MLIIFFINPSRRIDMQAQTELNFEAAVDARNVGMMMAEDHANRRVDGWSEMAINMLRCFLLENPTRDFLTEEFRAYAVSNGLPEPPSNRAFGGIMARARNTKIIQFVGFRNTSNPKSHATPASVWKKS
jgi:hypothetical protein